MREPRFTESQVLAALKRGGAGMTVAELNALYGAPASLRMDKGPECLCSPGPKPTVSGSTLSSSESRRKTRSSSAPKTYRQT